MNHIRQTHRFARSIGIGLIALTTLTACSGEMPVEKAVLGTWIQETPVSMSAENLRTTTSDTILTLKKNGDVKLSRVLVFDGAGLPDGGIGLNVDLSGHWRFENGQLIQTADSASITPRAPDDTSREWADAMQAQAADAAPSIKDIVAANKDQLILQDVETGATDVYRRK